MPKLTKSTPKYRKHRASGQAVVSIEGHDFYLGPHGTKASHTEYDRIICEWLANGRRLPAEEQGDCLTVTEVLNAYRKHANVYYRDTGTKRGTFNNQKPVLRAIRVLYGNKPSADFGPMALKAIMHKFASEGLSRGTINERAQLIKRIFRWAASEELIPASVPQALQTVEGLRKGRTKARESKPVLPVPEADVQATLPHLPEVVCDMVRLQRLTGCRPGEVCLIRPADVDSTEDIWTYQPEHHKMEHHGRERVIFIGPKGQDILRKYLLRPEWDYCFSPKDSEARRRFLANQARKTPLSCGNRPGTNRKAKPQRSAGKRYTNDSYRRAIHRACEKAGIPKWSPNRLRHSAATEIRRKFGLEGGQVVLGHAKADTTQIYAERDMQKAAEIMREIG